MLLNERFEREHYAELVSGPTEIAVALKYGLNHRTTLFFSLRLFLLSSLSEFSQISF